VSKASKTLPAVYCTWKWGRDHSRIHQF